MREIKKAVRAWVWVHLLIRVFVAFALVLALAFAMTGSGQINLQWKLGGQDESSTRSFK